LKRTLLKVQQAMTMTAQAEEQTAAVEALNARAWRISVGRASPICWFMILPAPIFILRLLNGAIVPNSA
jgi:hypothetical protein